MASIVRKVISSAKAPKALGPYSQAIQVGSTLYLSGQIGVSPDTGDFVGETVEEQAHQAFKNLGAVLEAAGTSYDKVVKATVLLADIRDFAAVNEIYGKYFSVPYPARAAYECSKLPKMAKIEIEAVAVVGDVNDQ